MQVTIRDSILRLATGISGGVVNLEDLILLGIGTLLIEPCYRIGELGQLIEVSYKSRKDGEVYTHQFHSAPTLAYSQTSLFVLNGKSHFNVREGVGIIEVEDLPKKD